MTATSQLTMTEEEFLARFADLLPSYEFVNGVVTQKPMTKRSHFLIADEVAAILREYRGRAGGVSGQEPTINFSRGGDRTYRVPDLAYWTADKDSGGEVMAPPTLAVEIPSPGQRLESLREKCRFMREAGTDACWLIDPEARRVEVFEVGRDGDVETGVLESPHLPGLRVELAALFAVLDE